MAEIPETVEQIFETDEKLVTGHHAWPLERLLETDGLYIFKDICERLKIDSLDLKNNANAIRNDGSCPWEVMGCRKLFNHWYVRIKVFAPFYKKKFQSDIKHIEDGINKEQVLNLKGLFYLSEVSKILELSPWRVRYRVMKYPNSKTEMGVWKDGHYYIIQMEIFAIWYRTFICTEKKP